jgi:hypothetical protein
MSLGLLMDLRDKGAPPNAQAGPARALALILALVASCGQNRPPPAAAPQSAPARDVIVRTGRFAIHLNAYVEYLAGRVGPGARDASEEGRPHDLDPDLVTKLEGCSDDRCAKAAFTGTREIEGLDGYLRETWPRDSDDARRAVGRSGTPLMELEDVIAPALASQIGRTWPNEPIDVYLARAPEIDPSGREGSLIDTEGECFGGRALLECLFTRAVEVLLPESDLGRGIDEARAALDALSRTKTDAAALCVAALAVDAAVGAADAGYRPTRRFSEACAPSLRPWLGDSWAKRIRGDLGAREFGAKLVEAMASQRP